MLGGSCNGPLERSVGRCTTISSFTIFLASRENIRSPVFAWTLFPEMIGFLASGIERSLASARLHLEMPSSPPRRDAGHFFSSSRSRSRGARVPHKRARPTILQDYDPAVKPARLNSSIPPSPPTSSDSSPHIIMHMALDVETTALERLVTESLRKERLLSHPGGTGVRS